MLLTPLGVIKLFVDDEEVEFAAIQLNNLESHCPDVNGRYLIQYAYISKRKSTIKCFIPSLKIIGEIESGEQIEAISFYKDDIKLTIGAECGSGFKGLMISKLKTVRR